MWLKILLLAAQSCLLDHLFHLNIALKMSLDMPFQVCDVFCKHAFDIFFLSLVNDGGIFQWFITVHLKKSLPVCNSLTHDFLHKLASTCTRVMIKSTLGKKNKNLSVMFNVGNFTLLGNGIQCFNKI